MRQQLLAGAELDILTRDEMAELVERYLAGYLRPPQRLRPTAAIPLNANGHTAQIGAGPDVIDLFAIKPGYRFMLHRLGAFPDGYTFGSPYTSGSGFLEILRNGDVQDGVGFSSPGLPQIWSGGSDDGIEFRNGERVQVRVTSGPASRSLVLRIEGTLQPLVED